MLLVGAGYGGTGFIEDVTAPTARWNFTAQAFENFTNLHHRWMATTDPNVGGDLYRGAVRRANDAMAVAGQNARFVGVIWHQGESDAVDGGADTYADNHHKLIAAFRANITGAGPTTPVVVGEFNPCFMSACPDRTGAQPTAATFQKILNYFHTIRSNIAYTAWVSSAGLGWNPDGTHFDLPSVRQLGRRYADKLFEASLNLPQPEVDFKIWNGNYFNVGTSMDGDPLSSRISGNVTPTGTVSVVRSANHGNVALIDNAGGSLSLSVDATSLNASYTKMAWIKLESLSYTNNMISGLNSMQRHFFDVSGGQLAAGHSATVTTTLVRGGAVLPVAKWAHVAVAYDADKKTMTLYVNGAATDSASGVAAAPSNDSGRMTLQLSRYGSASTTYGIDGYMIDNKLYRQALSPTQIKAIYDYETTKKAGY